MFSLLTSNAFASTGQHQLLLPGQILSSFTKCVSRRFTKAWWGSCFNVLEGIWDINGRFVAPRPPRVFPVPLYDFVLPWMVKLGDRLSVFKYFTYKE